MTLDRDIAKLYYLVLLLIEFEYHTKAKLPTCSSDSTPEKTRNRPALSENFIQNYIFCVFRVLCKRRGFTVHDGRNHPMLYLISDFFKENFAGKADIIICFRGKIRLIVEVKVFLSARNYSQFLLSTQAISCGVNGSWSSSVLDKPNVNTVYGMILNGFTCHRACSVGSGFKMDSSEKSNCLEALDELLNHILIESVSQLESESANVGHANTLKSNITLYRKIKETRTLLMVLMN